MTFIKVSPKGSSYILGAPRQAPKYIIAKGLFPRSNNGGVGGSVPTDTQLTVTSNGQTQFNIFTMPTAKTELIIDHCLFHEGIDYTFGTVGPNTVLIWGNMFPLSTTDQIFFRKY